MDVRAKPSPDYSAWTDRALQTTRAYLRNCVKDGHPGIYDREEDCLRLDNINQEIARRGIDRPAGRADQ